MKHLWSILCRHGVVDKDSNVLTLVDVLEEVSVQFHGATPDPVGSHVLQIQMELVTLWSKEELDRSKTNRFRVVLETPGDPQPTVRPECTVKFSDDKLRVRSIAKTTALLWRGVGTYTFFVQVLGAKGKWKTVAELPFEVRIKPEPTQQVVQPKRQKGSSKRRT